MPTSVAVLGDYDPAFAPHVATTRALGHSSEDLGVELEAVWIATDAIDESLFSTHAGIWVAPGSPYRDMQRTLQAIRYARENGVPCLGTCGGFQHVILEYARNVLGFVDAQHAEYDPSASRLFISELACSLAGREMSLRLVDGSRAATAYGDRTATEEYYCNFGVNPEYVDELSRGPLQVVGADDEGEIRIVELRDHPFFIATLFVPQTRSLPGQPHPLVTEFVRAVVRASESGPP